LSPLGFSSWTDLYDLVNAQSGKQIFSEYFRIVKDRELLLVEPKVEQKVEEYWISETETELNFPLNLRFTEVDSFSETNSNAIFVDVDTLKFPLLLRKWQKGDYFYPFGMNGTKKLSKFFKDEKFSLIEKENQWLLCADNQIIWIIGRRMDNRFKISENTQTIIKIELQ
jgi:tRNA(Ile)-lysidine synthase